MTTIFHYDRDTKRLLGTGQADPNPLDPDDPIVPAFATKVAPPGNVPAGQAPYWNEGAQVWDVLPVKLAAAPPNLIDDIEPDERTERDLRQHALECEAEELLDGYAQALGYRNMDRAITYADEPAVPQYQAEGQALRQFRSIFWQAFYAELAGVPEGSPIPAWQDFLPLLPVFQAPA